MKLLQALKIKTSNKLLGHRTIFSLLTNKTNNEVLYLFNGVDRVALGRDGDTEVVVVVSVLEEASILLVLSGFLSVGNGEEMILANKPVAEATVFHNLKRQKQSSELRQTFAQILDI